MDIDEYEDLIRKFQGAGYRFRLFTDSVDERHSYRSVLMRHDVDFSLALASQMAEWEYQNDVKASYFIQLRSPLYNALSNKSRLKLQLMASQGHAIGLHFDASIYSDPNVADVSFELETLEVVIPSLLRAPISLHKPMPGLDNIRNWSSVRKLATVYDAPWTTEFCYFSDSGGRWRNGSPADSEEFRSGRSMQVLVHPLWWMVDGKTPAEQLRSFADAASLDTADSLRESAVSLVF